MKLSIIIFRFTTLLLLFFSGATVTAQWQAYTLTDTVGTYDLRIAHGNDQVAWSIAMKYKVTATDIEWVPSKTLFFAKTNDGGNTWSSGTIPMGIDPYASNVCPLSKDVAWASGVDEDYASYVLRTTDGGTTWKRFMEDKFIESASYVNFVHLWDAQNGVAVGDPAPSGTGTTPFFEIYRTTDGGTTWQRVPSANIPPPINKEYGIGGDYEVRGNHVWFSTIDGNDFTLRRIYHSKDRGQTWRVLDPPGTSFGAWTFADSLHGIVVTRPVAAQPLAIQYTADGGTTWTQLPPFNPSELGGDWSLIPQSYFLMSFRRVNNTTGPFTTYLSKDLGETWQQIATNDYIAVTYFNSPTLGYAGGGPPLGRATRMYKYNGSPLTGLLANHTLEARIVIAPNPAADFAEVTVEVEQPDTFLFLLNDAQGRLLQRQVVAKTAQANVRFDLKNVPAGIYTITVSTEKGHLVRQIVKNE
jgi:hypothetical protein